MTLGIRDGPHNHTNDRRVNTGFKKKARTKPICDSLDSLMKEDWFSCLFGDVSRADNIQLLRGAALEVNVG
jgi:hypothetical protein